MPLLLRLTSGPSPACAVEAAGEDGVAAHSTIQSSSTYLLPTRPVLSEIELSRPSFFLFLRSASQPCSSTFNSASRFAAMPRIYQRRNPSVPRSAYGRRRDGSPA